MVLDLRPVDLHLLPGLRNMPVQLDNKSSEQRINAAENSLATEAGLAMASRFLKEKGRPLPTTDIEFAGMLAIAYLLGRESIAGRVAP